MHVYCITIACANAKDITIANPKFSNSSYINNSSYTINRYGIDGIKIPHWSSGVWIILVNSARCWWVVHSESRRSAMTRNCNPKRERIKKCAVYRPHISLKFPCSSRTFSFVSGAGGRSQVTSDISRGRYTAAPAPQSAAIENPRWIRG